MTCTAPSARPRRSTASTSRRPGRARRAARSVGLRQDDRAAGAGRLRERRLRRGRRRRPGRPVHPGAATRHGHGVPELQPVPQHERPRQRRVRPADAQGRRCRPPRARRRAARHGRPVGAGQVSTRTSCPAASSSASRWPGRSPSSRASCCSTSRCPPSTPRCGCSCASRSGSCSPSSAPPRCASRTTRRRRCRWPTGSASWATAGSSRSPRRPTSTPGPPPRSSRSSSAR